jgi:hypothetical protein
MCTLRGGGVKYRDPKEAFQMQRLPSATQKGKVRGMFSSRKM